MYEKRFPAIIAGLGALFLFISICFFAARLPHASPASTPSPVPREADMYRYQGLAPGIQLASVPLRISDTRIEFSDRVLLRNSWTEEEMERSILSARELLTAFHLYAPNVNTYVAAVPLRIGFEESFSSDSAYLNLVAQERRLSQYLEETYLRCISDLAVGIPLISPLLEHQDEYIFYRTDAAWSALGAYYGAQEFLQQAQLDPFSLTSFYEYCRRPMSGSLVSPEAGITDQLFYYLYKDYNPLVNRPAEGLPTRMIIRTNGGVGAFLGGSSIAFFDGLSENGRTVLLMGGENANVFSPWLLTQFERIICINLPLLNEDDLNLWNLVQENQVTDFLLLEDAELVKSFGICEKIRRLAQQP